MKYLVSLNKSKFVLIVGCIMYVIAIAAAAQYYLPFQIYAPGVFKEYSYTGLRCIGLIPIAILTCCFLPKNCKLPSDIYLVIINVFVFAPALTLCLGTNNINDPKKIILVASLIIVMYILRLSRKLRIGGRASLSVHYDYKYLSWKVSIVWLVLFSLLISKYYPIMAFKGFDDIYSQRELTSGDVRGLWGYIQLYFTYVFSTLLITHGLTKKKWHYFIAGSTGYLAMNMIAADKSTIAFIAYFLIIYYLSLKKINLESALSGFMIISAVLTISVVLFATKSLLFDLIGYLFVLRILAIPGQFVIDYYSFFSENGYTFFSQIRGFDLFINAPSAYMAHPKWPQIGWIVGTGEHQINSNSNATFIAADGAASLGALGMILVALFLMFYLVMLNQLSYKLPKLFWALIASQQALLLVSGSLFTIMLSYGGLFYLIFFFLHKPLRISSFS